MRYLLILLLPFLAAGQGSEVYYPEPGEAWKKRTPESMGLDGAALREAIAHAEAHETSMPGDPGAYLHERFEGKADQDIVGPTKERGGVNGIVIYRGYIVAEWGDTRRADMTFSVTKSYLSTVAALAEREGLLPDLDRRVGLDVAGDLFESPQNRDITWRHLLQQTTEWEGTLFGKPDTADRRRGIDRTLQRPGTFWEYNDVRVNLLALSLLHLWNEPLPGILKEEIMDPIGASDSWSWNGYDTSFVELEGRRVQSVSGGGHWGGGLFISTRDHARFGYLFLRNGRWKDRQILRDDWVARATTPVAIQPNYGFMWWLNTGRERFPSAPESSFFALGAGSTSTIWVDPEHDLVVVSRWVEGADVDGVIARVLRAVGGSD